MDYSQLLNNQQLEAVLHTDGSVLVSAGAGSGKTRLLTYRVAYLITECHIEPYNILAITFTNKAAKEMKERIIRTADNGDLVTVCTFHSLCAKLLRQYASFLNGYESNFSIYTEQEQAKLYKSIFTNLGFDKTDEKTKNDIKNSINKVKTDNLNIEEYCQIHKYYNYISYVKRVYEAYQSELKRNNAMDFDDLLINLYQLLKSNQQVRETIQNRYQYIHVDEFQDTNTLQYEIIKILADKYKNILVVGDEDQSIYSWRGANIDNIFKFTQDFPNCKIIKLEQNYRSTKAVLDKANKLIRNNQSRIDKQLYTQNEAGDKVEYYSAYEESDEADYVVRQIMFLHQMGLPYNEMAILMRLNALTRPFEEKLLNYNIPHKIYNGFKFYDRAEIKNTLAYLVAVANPNDDNNIARIIAFPSKKIGETSIQQMQDLACARRCSLKDIIINSRNLDLKEALKNKLEPLAKLLTDIDEKVKEKCGIYDLITYIIENACILESFDKNDEHEYDKWMNINSLVNSIKDYERDNPDASFTDYLETISLTSQLDEEDKNNGVILATVHGAKGLEFDTVFVVGLEEKIFPISRDDDNSMEEERRLMYVAITRAKKKLFLTNARSRFMYGKREPSLPSRFLKEIDLIKDKAFDYISPYADEYRKKRSSQYSYEEYSTGQKYSNSKYVPSFTTETKKTIDLSSIKGLSKGISKASIDSSKVVVDAMVSHPKFGTGKIIDIKDFAKNSCITINFEALGKKTLALDYAPITFIDE